MPFHGRVTPSIKFAGTHLYTIGTVGAKCLAQEHNIISRTRAQTQTAHSEVKHTNHKATAPSQLSTIDCFYRNVPNLFDKD